MLDEKILKRMPAGTLFICEHPEKKFSDAERSQLSFFKWESYWCKKPAVWELPTEGRERDLEECVTFGLAYAFTCEEHKRDLLLEKDEFLKEEAFIPEIGMVFLFKQSQVKGTVVKVEGNGVVLKILGNESNMITIDELLEVATQI